MAKDEQFLVIILIITLLDTASSLVLSQTSLTKNPHQSLVVVCRDEAGRAVTWEGPRGTLNAGTHPQVNLASYGTYILFNKTKIEDTGNYTCILNNSPEIRKVFSLTIQDTASSLVISQTSLTRNPNTTVVITCRDEAGEPVTWKGPRGMLNAKTHPQVKRASYGTYILFNTTKIEDTGNYTCILIKAPATKKVFSLTIQEVLEFRNTPKHQNATEGKSFTLQCHTNVRSARITWSLVNRGVLDEKRLKLTSNGLYFRNVTREDAQVYQCLAIQDSGTPIYRDIELDVHHAPSLPYNVFAEEDEVYAFQDEPTFNLTCKVEANPPPTFTWSHRNMGQILNVSSHISVLQLNVTEDTPGTYMCTASNGIGQLKKYFDVQLGERPDKPEGIELLTATNESLEIKVKVPEIPYEVRNPSMDPQWIVVEYKPVSEEEWNSVEFNITSDSVVLTGLSKKTRYEVKAAMKNIAGLSQYYSNQTIFETSRAPSVHTKLQIVIYLPVILISLFWIA